MLRCIYYYLIDCPSSSSSYALKNVSTTIILSATASRPSFFTLHSESPSPSLAHLATFHLFLFHPSPCPPVPLTFPSRNRPCSIGVIYGKQAGAPSEFLSSTSCMAPHQNCVPAPTSAPKSSSCPAETMGISLGRQRSHAAGHADCSSASSACEKSPQDSPS